MTLDGRAGSGPGVHGASACWLLATICLLVAGVAETEAQTIANEYRLKAVFLYQFPQFVEWPASVWQDATTVQICILRPNPFGQELDALVRGESLQRRPLAVRPVTGADALAGCHLLFVSATAPGADGVLKAARTLPILTVGEGERFLDDGGIIALRIVERRVRFDVNAWAAQKVGLQISSQLLSLALSVRGGPS